MHNRIKDQLAAGKPAFGAQLRFGSPAIAELFGHSGFDFLVIDSEHAPQTPTGIQAQLQAIGNTPATPIVRLPRIDEEQIRLYLDMGALGILAPFCKHRRSSRRRRSRLPLSSSWHSRFRTASGGPVRVAHRRVLRGDK